MKEQVMQLSRFAKFAWITLGYNIVVILWGAYVRATGSGAGCGAHWPVCNGEIIPRAPAAETVVEFSHRLSSGLALVLVVALFIWAFRAYPKGDKIRKAVSFSLLFIITEALVGAGLVLFRWVADDASMARVYSMAVHLINTFLLLAFLALTAYYASGRKKVQFRNQGLVGLLCLLAGIAMLVLGVSGAVIALGDTLVLEAGLSPDDSPVVAMLVSVRIYHPSIAVLVSLFIVLVSRYIAAARPSTTTHRMAQAILILSVVQLGVGVVNVALRAPVIIQLIHLLIAVLMWLAVVFMSYSALEEDAERSVSVKWSHILSAG